MRGILLLPGDGPGPETISVVERAIAAAAGQVEVVRGDIGFSAYEKYGSYLPYETLDVVGKYPVVVSGPTTDFGEGEDRRNPLGMLMSQLDLFARSRRFMTLADGIGAPGVDVTVWGSNVNPAADVSETPDVDGITISKYIRSDIYSRMMGAARADMVASGKARATCVAREDLFPESSGVFYDAFDRIFDSDGISTEHVNIRHWIPRAVREPRAYEFLVVADLYSTIADSLLSGLTGGGSLVPTRYSGDGSTLILPGRRHAVPGEEPEEPNPVSSFVSASMALYEIGLKDESDRIMDALRGTLAADGAPRAMGGPLDAGGFADRVVSRIRANRFVPSNGIARA